MGQKFYGALVLLALLLVAGKSYGQGNFESNGNGNWASAGTWTLVSGTDADGIPDADDNVVIRNPHTVSVSDGAAPPSTHECNSITINNGATLRTNSGTTVRTLNVYGSLTIAAGGTYTVNDVGGTVEHFLNIGGDFINNGTFTSLSGNTTLQVTFNGSNQLIDGSATSTFRDVTIASGSTTTIDFATTIGGSFLIEDAATFDVAGFDFIVNGTTTIGGGTSGTLLFSSTTALTKRFVGLVTLNAGASWNNAINESINFRGGITKNATATFTAGTGIYTFETNSQALSGSFVIPNITVTGVTLTNNDELSVSNALSGTGGLTQAANAILNIGGTSGITTLTATAAGNTVNYTGAAQTVHSNTYVNLGLSGTNTKTLQAGTTSISGNLTLSGAVSSATVANITIGGDLSIGDNCTFTVTGITFQVTGQTIIGGGTSGVLAFSATPSGKIFVGLVTINAGGTWDNTAGESVVFRGGITNNPTGNFNTTGTTAVYTFNTVSQTLTGSFTVPRVTVTGVGIRLINTNDLTVTTVLAGSGTIQQASGSILNIGGTSTISVLDATTAVPNTVNYTGAAQTVHPSNYSTLGLSGSGTKTLQAGTTTISGNFNLSGTATTTTVVGLDIGGSVSIGNGATLNAASFTHTVAGDWTDNGGTFTPATSTITFDGSGPQAINGTDASQTFNNIIIAKTAGQALSVNGSTTTLNVANFTQTSGDFNSPALLDVAGVFTLTSGSHSAGATTNIGGNFINNGGSFVAGTGTVIFDGTTQSIGGTSSTTFNNLSTSGATNTSTGVATVINGNLFVGDGTTFTVAGFDLTVGGTTTIGTGTSGILAITSTTGTKIFEGLVLINTNGYWNNSANEAITFRGGITNNWLFTAGSALQTFDTNNQALSGTLSIPSITVNGVTLTNNGSFGVSTSLSGTGNFTQAVGATLNLGGAFSISSLTATAAGNTIEYTGASQTIFPTDYFNLLINQSSGEASLSGDASVSNTLTLTARNLNLNGNILTLGTLANAIAGGPFSSAKMIIATGGSEVRKIFGGAGTFSFPIGDNTGTLEYSPVVLTSNGASTIGVSVVDAKHPNNASTTNFLTRYWNVTSSSAVSVDLIAGYVNLDIAGTEVQISTAQLDGIFDRDTNPWVKSTALDAANNEAEFTGALLASGQTSSFTGISGAGPVAAINTGAGITICEGDVQALLATVASGGDAPFTFSWSPATALSATNIANPSANPVADVTYTVTITDANGIEDTESTIFTVNPQPAAPAVTFTTNTYCVNAVITPPTTTGIGLQWWSNATLLTLLPTADAENPTAAELGFSTVAAGTTTVYVTQTVGGCRGPATAVTLTVRANPIADAGAASVDVCEGESIILGGSPTATAGAGSYTYSWSPATGLNNAAIANPTLTTSSAGSQVYTVTITDANTCQSTDNITVNTLASPAAPIVTFTPSTYCTGATLVAPTTAGTALQWWSDITLTTPLATVSPTNPTGAELGFSTAAAGITTVFVTQTVNGCRSAATPVTLNVISGITASLVSNDADNTMCDGTTVLFTATPIGALSYDFILNGNFGTPIQSGASNTFSTNTLNDGDQLEVVVTGGGGCTDVSNAIINTVIPTATVDVVTDQTLCNGNNTTLITFTGTNATSYTWTNNNTSIGLAANGVGNINTFVATNTGTSPLVASITVTANNGACVGTSQVFAITVNPTPALSSTLTPVAICSGDTFTYTPTSATVGATFNWSRALVAGITEAASTGTNDPSETLTNTTALPINVTYAYTIAANGCNQVQNVVVSVNPTPVVNNPTDETVCAGASVTALNFTGTATSYSWTNNNTSIGLAGSGVGNIASFTAVNNGTSVQTATITITPIYNGCIGATQDVVITVNPIPNVSASNAVICSGSTTNIVLSNPNSVLGTQYTWAVVESGVSGGSNQLTSSAGPIAQTLSTTSSSPGTATYTITPIANACPGTSLVIVVTVNPIPTASATPATQTICSGETTNIALTNPNTVVGTSYSWTVVTSNITGAFAGSGNTISQVLSSTTGNTQGTATYTITPRANGCDGPTTIATITVNPNPTLAVNNTTFTICNGATPAIALSNPNTVTGTQYVWTVASTNVTGAADQATPVAAGAINTTLSLSPTANTPGTVVYTVHAVANGCYSASRTVTVNVNPIPNVSASSVTICSGSTTNIGITNPNVVGGTTYSWTQVSTNVSGANAGSGNVISQLLTSTDGINSGNVSYTITPSANGCAGTPINIIVTVNPSPTFSVANSTAEICSGTATNLTFTSPTTGHRINVVSVNYGAVSGGTVVAGATTFTNTNVLAETLTNNTNAPIDVVYTFNVTTPFTTPVCPVSPVTQTVTVRVLPAPVFSLVNNATEICSNEKTNIALTTPVSGARIRLVSVNYSTASGTLVAGAIFENAQVVEDLLTNTTNTSATVNYVFEALVGSCLPSASQNVSVVVKPRPVITTASTLLTREICSGESLSFTATTDPASTVNWTSIFTSQINGATVSSSGSGAITDTPLNISNVNGTVTYTLTPIVNGCVGTSRDYVVTVKPLPSVTTSNVIICSESAAIFNLSSAPQNITGTTYAWTTTNTGVISGQSNGDGSSINQTLVTDNVGGVVSYTITPAANGCFGPSAVYTATVNPKAIVNAGPDFAVCEPADVAIAGTLAGSATVGTWSVVSGQGFGSVAGSGLNDIYTVAPADIGTNVTLLLTSNDPDGAGPCPIVTDQLVISVNRQARVTAPLDYTLCEPTDFLLTSTLSGSATGGSWSVIDGDGTLTVSSITLNTVSASYIPALSDVSTTLQFRITTNDPDGSGPCLVATDDVLVTINQAARITAGPDFEVCEDEPLVLNGTKSGATSVVNWTGGTGTFANAAAESTAYTLSTTEFNALSQVLTFRLTTDDPDGTGPCTSVFDEVMVTVNDTTEIIFFGLDPVYAENQPPVTLLPNPSGGVFTGPGITAGTTIFSPEFADVGSINKITYTYINPVTSCSSIFSRNTIVNPITTVAFRFEDNKGAVEVNQNLVTICAETGDIELIGDPLVNTPPVAPVNAFFSSTTAGIISQVGLRYFLRTDGLAGGSYFVTYTYTNEFNATNSITREVYVYSAPQARIRGLVAGGNINNDADLLTSIDGCISDDVQFVGRSSDIINNQTGASIVEYNWNFDDNGNTSVAENPIYSFGQSRFYNISLRVRTNQQCFSDTTIAVQVGKPPLVDFSWSKVCSGDVTEFSNNSKTGISKALAVNWDFGDLTIVNKEPLTLSDTVNVNTPWNPYHMFPTGPAQAYDITLTVKTEEGCSASLTKNAFILTSGDAQQLASTGYREDFRNGQGTWFPTNSTLENVTATSWDFGVPDGTTINNATNNAWFMREYQNIDNSVVIGPCLNLSGLTKPMISLDFWSDTNEALDGAVLQYSLDEGETWRVLGNNSGNGVNWYKSSTITGDPGNQTLTTFNRFGWSGESGGWQNARYSLDEIPAAERDKVVFRIAFGSNNPSDRDNNGFAFDNIYIGDKQKLVLLEHFTNNTTTLVNFNNEIDAAYATDTVGRNRQSNFLKLQYHMANPNAGDEFNINNPGDPSVRSFFYGVETPPFTIMNGALGNYSVGNFNPFNTNFNGLFSRITPQVINREALLAPKFDLKLELDNTNNDPAKIEFKTSLTYIDSVSVNFNEAVNVYVVLYESGVAGQESPVENVVFRNVVRQMLSGSGGITINQPWVWGGLNANPTVRESTVDIRTQFQQADSLWVVAFVQNRNTREIYQTVVQKVAKPKVPLLPVGLEEELVKAELEQIQMYPNPASNKVNLFAEGILSQQYEWRIVSQQGVQVMSGSLEREFFAPKEIVTEELADGVYFMVFGTKGEPLHYKKLVIVNRR